MGFGKHWEWRGFGVPSESLTERIRGFPTIYATPQKVTDRYLWTPGCEVNLKLRFAQFKIKRLVDEGVGGVEEWLEDPHENYDFPLDGLLYHEVATIFGSEGAPRAVSLEDEHEFLDQLSKDIPDLQVFAVDKLRWQHRGPEGTAEIVEFAEIRAPEACVSIGIEDDDPEKIRRTLEELGLPGELRTLNYLQAIDLWGRGKQVLDTAN